MLKQSENMAKLHALRMAYKTAKTRTEQDAALRAIVAMHASMSAEGWKQLHA
jgi:hypothetical protein